MKNCLLIPVYNESQAIGPLIKSIRARGLDVVVIDDGSTDSSGEIAKSQGAIVIRQDKKKGKGYSLRKGFNYILEKDYEGIVTLDGDGQHDIDDIDEFIRLAQDKEMDIIVGNRMTNARNMPFLRYVTNRFMSVLISSACKQAIPDTQCGYRFIRCDALKALSLKSNDFEIETEILMKASNKGKRIYSIPIKTIYSSEVSHINPFRDTIRFFVYFIKEIKASTKKGLGKA